MTNNARLFQTSAGVHIFLCFCFRCGSQNLFLYSKMWRAECMSEVLYRGYFSDDYELMCNWQWDTRDDTLEISV